MAEKLKLGAKTAIEIDKMRDGYRPAAKRGAILFFVLSEMSTINRYFPAPPGNYTFTNNINEILLIYLWIMFYI